MKPPIKTTSSTGSNSRGFTFIEVMVTLVVLSAGIVLIYKSFFLCADYFSRLSLRLQASELVDEKIAEICREIHASGDLSAFDRGETHVTRTINHAVIPFYYQIELDPQPSFDDLYRLRVSVSWMDKRRRAQMMRSVLVGL